MQMKHVRRGLCAVLAFATLSGCALFRARAPTSVERIEFDPVLVVGDLELEKLNDEELFAQGTAAFAAEDFANAARFFVRLTDFFPQSPHRRAALYNAGLSLEKVKKWDAAREKFAELAEPKRGTGDALDASFREAETLYHLERFADAAAILKVLAGRGDLSLNQRIEAQTQQGVCELEGGDSENAEKTFRKVIATWSSLPDRDVIEDYFPAQAQFFLGEVFRLHTEAVKLNADQTVDELKKELEYKAELLLSAQGHYLRAIRIGNGYWATAAGERIGSLYEGLYVHMVNTPAPTSLDQEEAAVYRQELRKKIRVLITKAINIYERTLEAAERIGANSPFVERTRESLNRMKALLIAEAQADDGPAPATAPAPPPPKS